MDGGNLPYPPTGCDLGVAVTTRFEDRRHAGTVLADHLMAYAGRDDVTVLALPRGGVPVAHEVATRLAAPLDVVVVRKLGLPGQEELAMGAIASGGATVLNRSVLDASRVDDAVLERVIDAERTELARRETAYRGDRPPAPLAGRTVIVVDDGLATGSTMHAAVIAVRQRAPARVVVAVPVGAPQTVDALAAAADEVVCPLRPPSFTAVGAWYDDFAQTTDEEVRRLLDAGHHA